MADESDKDTLSSYHPLFLLALAGVWLVVLALLFAQLVGDEWTADYRTFVMLGVLVGIAFLPFVTSFRLGGLFEFRRDLDRLSDDVREVRQSILVMSQSTAMAAQQTRQQVIVSTKDIEDLTERQGEEQARSQAALATSDLSPAHGPSWRSWQQFRLIARLYELGRVAEEEGYQAFDALQGDPEALSSASLDRLMVTGDLDRQKKAELKRAIELAERLDNEEDVSNEELEEVSQLLLQLTAYLGGRLASEFVWAKLAYEAILARPETAPEIVRELYDEGRRRERDPHNTGRGGKTLDG